MQKYINSSLNKIAKVFDSPSMKKLLIKNHTDTSNTSIVQIFSTSGWEKFALVALNGENGFFLVSFKYEKETKEMKEIKKLILARLEKLWVYIKKLPWVNSYECYSSKTHFEVLQNKFPKKK